MTTHILDTAAADISYDVHGPLPTADGRPPLFMIGQPMDASGFGTISWSTTAALHRADAAVDGRSVAESRRWILR